MGFSKRSSGPPRRPRNPVAKNVRTPQFKTQVVPDKRWQERMKDLEEAEHPEEPEQDKEQHKEQLDE